MTDEDAPMVEATSDMSTERRLAERGVGMASYWFVLSLVFIYLSVSGGVPGSGTAWFVVVGSAVAAVGCVALGIGRLRFRARNIAAFEARHGADAGRLRGERGPRFHIVGIFIFALLLVYLIGVLIWTLSTGVRFSIPQWMVVGLLFLLAVLGLAWQVRCLVVALPARDRQH